MNCYLYFFGKYLEYEHNSSKPANTSTPTRTNQATGTAPSEFRVLTTVKTKATSAGTGKEKKKELLSDKHFQQYFFSLWEKKQLVYKNLTGFPWGSSSGKF